VSVTVGYRVQSNRLYARAGNVADPQRLHWERGAMPRHAFVLSANYQGGRTSIQLYGGLASGDRYTPLVSGDINGDGAADAAFLPAVSGQGNSEFDSDFAAALANMASKARACVVRQLGQIAHRNSCTGPWQADLDMSMAITLPRRMGFVTIGLQNALGAIDWVVHGGTRHGWGDNSYVDPTLLYVRGFDPVTRQFRYTVNERFGTSGSSLPTTRRPIFMSFTVSRQFTPDPEVARLKKLAEQIPVGDAAAALAAYARNDHVVPRVLALSEWLTLTREQILAIRKMGPEETARYEAGFRDVAIKFSLPETRADMNRMKAVWAEHEEVVKRLRRESLLKLRPLLADDQWEMVAPR
jgi:hypothetical protein